MTTYSYYSPADMLEASRPSVRISRTYGKQFEVLELNRLLPNEAPVLVKASQKDGFYLAKRGEQTIALFYDKEDAVNFIHNWNR